jgi:hypothetical protein
LKIVDMLSASWGVVPEQPSGKTVWFTVPATTGAQAASGGLGSRRRLGGDVSAVAAAQSTVRSPEKTPNAPTSQYGRGTGRYRVPCGPRGAAPQNQGRRSRLRCCRHDDCGSHGRPRRDLERLR